MQLFYNEEADINDIIDKLIIFARHKGYRSKKVGRDILEIDKSGTLPDTWRLLLGLSIDLRVLVTLKQGKTEVYLSNYQKEFVIKAVVGVALLVCFPLVVIPIHGALEQYKLIEAIKSEINDYFNSIN